MANFIPEGCHSYLHDGTPYYEVEMKTKPGKFRPVNIKDIKEAGALPSWSSISKVLNKPELTNWLINKHLHAYATYPFPEGLNEDEKIKLVLSDAGAETRDALDLGSVGHSMIEYYVQNGGYAIPKDVNLTDTQKELLLELLAKFAKWWTLKPRKVIAVEKHFGNPALGIGGRVDLITEEPDGIWITDHKFTKNGKPYPEMFVQMIIYKRGLMLSEANVRSTLFGKETIDFNPHDWDMEKEQEAWNYFQACFTIWMINNNYDPREEVV